MKNKRLKLVNTIHLIIFISLLLLTASMVILQISKYRNEFTNRAKAMRTNFLDQQKNLIKTEVNRVIDMINYEKFQSIDLAKSNIKYHIDEASAIAENIYQNNINLQTDTEIKKMIMCALRPIRFDMGKGYFFITHLDGTEILFSDKPEMEGTNIINIMDTEGKYVVKDMIDIINQDSKGYYEYFWAKPGEVGNNHKKITYIKSLGFYDWFMGTGVYVEDIEQRLQKTIGNYVTRYRFGKQNQDYVFVMDLINIDGGKDFAIMYANANRPDIIGEYISDDYKDANGKEFRKEALEGLRATGECYVNYWYKKIENSEPSPKISYFKLSDDKNFIVAAGVYLDEIEAGITELQITLNDKLKKYILNTILITIILLFIILIITYYITQKLLADFSLFTIFFNQSVHENKEIDLSKIRFENLYQMAISANTMLREKREAKQHVLDEKEQLAVTLRSIGDAVITVDLESKIILLNRVAEELTGWSEKNAKGKLLEEVFTIFNANSRNPVKNPVEEVFKNEIVASLSDNTILISKTGKEYDIEDSAAPIKTADSTIIGAVLVFRDVTEQIKKDQNLIKAKKLESVGILAGGIAHDFNNLLTGLYGNIQMAKLHLSTKDDSYKYLDSAVQSMDRATNLTNQLLTFAKGGDPIIENLSIGRSIVEIAEFSLLGSNSKLQSYIDPDLWMVKADKGQLSQVISNLIINAHQAMPNGGKITISAENSKIKNNKYIQITIQDEGEGIESQYIDKIFDPYFSTKQYGSGLGLASTYSIIKKHNGIIKVNSELQNGTLFTIYLPAAENSDDSLKVQLSDKKEGFSNLSAKILVLDDEEIVRNVIGAMLKRMGHDISYAVNGHEAVQKYKKSFEIQDPYNIIITDLTIPGGMGGQKASEEILKINPQAKIIVSSGYATDPIMANYKTFGFIGIAVKPYSFKDLEKEIDRVLMLNYEL